MYKANCDGDIKKNIEKAKQRERKPSKEIFMMILKKTIEKEKERKRNYRRNMDDGVKKNIEKVKKKREGNCRENLDTQENQESERQKITDKILMVVQKKNISKAKERERKNTGES